MSDPSYNQKMLLWWAQELQRAYVAKRRQTDRKFTGLVGDWAQVKRWEKLAAKLMHCGLDPGDTMDALFQCAPSSVPPPFELAIAAASVIFQGMTRLNSMTEEEAQEMISLKLNPTIQADKDLYYLREKIKYWTGILSRASGTLDVKDNGFCQNLVSGIFGTPPWVCYLINPTREEVFRTYSEEAFQYFTAHPAVGYAAIRLGFPKEMIYPYGSPYGD